MIDVRGGLVVRAVAGDRQEYAPYRPAWGPSADPFDFARTVRDRFETHRLYLADLDAIETGGPTSPRANVTFWNRLAADGFDLLLDLGVRHAGDLRPLLSPDDSRVVAATESIESPEALVACAAVGCVLGLDLRAGSVLGPPGAEAAVRASDAPVLVLDLAAVGTGGGVPTLPRCRELLAAKPGRAVLTGGGVRSIGDVRKAAAAGVSELLVASALYDGRLGADDLRPFLAPPA